MPSPSFSFRAGVRLRGSVVGCDVTAGGGLMFLSRAPAPGRRKLPRARTGRGQLLVTDETLALLGADGERLRRVALTARYGRPFTLGELRLEIFPSGVMPGSASLLCEVDGRRMVYAGAIRPTGSSGSAMLGTAPAEVRQADALCLDAGFASPELSFPERDECLGRVLRFVEAALAAGRAPVVLAPAYGVAMDVADVLARAGHPLRAHREVMDAAAAYRRAGATVPRLLRFGRALRPGEVLLWPPDRREAPGLNQLDAAFVLASGWAADPEAVSRARVDEAVPLSSEADLAGLLRYAEATGAREIAVVHGFVDHAVRALRERGHEAYALGPPRQIELLGLAPASGKVE